MKTELSKGNVQTPLEPSLQGVFASFKTVLRKQT